MFISSVLQKSATNDIIYVIKHINISYSSKAKSMDTKVSCCIHGRIKLTQPGRA